MMAYRTVRLRISEGHLKAAFGFLIFIPRRMLPATAGALVSGASFTASRRAGSGRDAGSQLQLQCLAALRGLGLALLVGCGRPCMWLIGALSVGS